MNQSSVDLGFFNITVNAQLDQLFSGAPSGGDAQYSMGAFALSHCDGAALTDICRYSGGSLTATHLDVAAIPEPATWALMLIGLGGLGVALRRRRRSVARAAA